jgi:hypothetical protein
MKGRAASRQKRGATELADRDVVRFALFMISVAVNDDGDGLRVLHDGSF